MKELLPRLAGWYLLCMSAAGLAVTAWDKYAARKHAWRVSERTLFLLAAAGGAAGVFLGMLLARHKTRKARFLLGIPALCILHAWMYCALWTNLA